MQTVSLAALATMLIIKGGGAGFHSEMRIYPQHGFASVITSNRLSFDSRQILSELDLHFVTTE